MAFHEVFIRKYHQEDWEQFYSIYFAGQWGNVEEYGFNKEKYAKYLENECSDLSKSMDFYFNANGYFWVAVEQDNQTVIGAVALEHLNNDNVELRRMCVKKEARGKGIGKALLQTFERYALEKGYKKIVLTTLLEFKTANLLYSSNGFKLLQTEPWEYDSDLHFVFFEKELV